MVFFTYKGVEICHREFLVGRNKTGGNPQKMKKMLRGGALFCLNTRNRCFMIKLV